MNPLNTYHDINYFKEGSIVSILDNPRYQDVTINRINEGGVIVSGRYCKEEYVSGKSPAILSSKKIQETIDILPQKQDNKSMSNSNPVSVSTSPVLDFVKTERVQRGTYTEKMKNLTLPKAGSSFTIKDLAELNGIPVNYAFNWVKDNCKEVGKAPKPVGQRGKSASLFQVK
jgi:hypothetical protein